MNDPVRKATIIQREASRPDVSVALRASAGSGKTQVLVDRFLRLCIEDTPAQAHPRSILAITFTRKAAVEIQERLLKRAEKMVLAGPEDLGAQLRDLFSDRADPEPTDHEMRRAAGLYEMVLEDLSGLHVGTIHSFCQLILGRFAAEAGLDPRFAVIENQDDLMDETLDQLEAEMARDESLAAVGRGVGVNPSAVRVAVKNVFFEQMRIERWLNRHEDDARIRGHRTRLDLLPAMLRDLRAFLFPELDPALEPDQEALAPLIAGTLEEFAGRGLDLVDAGMGGDAGRIEKNTAKLRADCQAALQGNPADLPAAARSILLTAADKTRVFTRIRDEDIKSRYNALVVENALPVLRLLHTAGYLKLYALNRDLLHLGLRVLDIYSELKRRDRVVDFQDLEDMARRLMGDEARALSLLYRLDDSIKHILLDEFQDTNFNQWDLLSPFIGEFLAGSTGEGIRTLFFVGDMKQAIYGFRGAEPVIFTFARQLLEERGQPVLELPTNFRSLQAVVEGVGCLFNALPLAESYSEEERRSVRQEWARLEATGEVVVLDPFTGFDNDNDDDNPDGRSGDQLAADAAARIVLNLKESGAVTWEGFGNDLIKRPLRWGDILVLTRSRTEISLYEKAFRNAGIPIVPPGRGMLAASREVQDILALLRWLVWPEDDVALAAVLRSPLFRLGQKDFQDVLARRGLFRTNDEGRLLPPRGLWRTLRKEEDDPVVGSAVRLLNNWRKHLGFESCHDLLRRIYREGLVLEKFQMALGDQARYNLMRLFDLALGPEMAGAPTVRRFVDLINRAASRGGQEEGTLPRGGAEGRVRFMTIHGAKGLEAPVVLLVDADRSTGKESARVRTDAGSSDTPLLFKVTKNYRRGFSLPDDVPWPADALQEAVDLAAARDGTEEANLLYVATTRARDRLYVLGGDKERGTDHDSPLRRIRESAAEGDCGHISRNDPEWLERPPAPAAPSATVPGDNRAGLESCRIWTPPVLRERVKIITPSTAEAPLPEIPATGGIPAGTRNGDPRLSGIERGNRVHRMLQAAADLGSLPPGTGDIHEEVAAVYHNRELTWVFHPEQGRGLCEVPVIHQRPSTTADQVPERITGSIDRLVLRPGRADIIDYKSNRLTGDPAYRKALIDHYRPQLAAYREVIEDLWPDREVHCWLLFTDPVAQEDPLSEVF